MRLGLARVGPPEGLARAIGGGREPASPRLAKTACRGAAPRAVWGRTRASVAIPARRGWGWGRTRARAPGDPATLWEPALAEGSKP
jgi:hypothetical protein